MAVVSMNTAEHYQWGDSCGGWHLVKTAALSVIHERVPHGCGEVRHLHNSSEQFSFVISGVPTVEVGGQIHQVKKI